MHLYVHDDATMMDAVRKASRSRPVSKPAGLAARGALVAPDERSCGSDWDSKP